MGNEFPPVYYVPAFSSPWQQFCECSLTILHRLFVRFAPCTVAITSFCIYNNHLVLLRGLFIEEVPSEYLVILCVDFTVIWIVSLLLNPSRVDMP
jgi:hypothetical protein